MNDISLRDYLAGQAIQGVAAAGRIPADTGGLSRSNREAALKDIARNAYAIADALLAEAAETARRPPQDPVADDFLTPKETRG